MSHYPQHLLVPGGCEAAACGVLGRVRTFQVRTLPAALPSTVLARQTLDKVTGSDS